MIKLSKLKKEWMKNPEFKKSYEELKPEFTIAKEFIRARIKANMTQEQVAAAMKTTQSVIARLEAGNTLPNMKTITRYAAALGMRPEIHFVDNKELR